MRSSRQGAIPSELGWLIDELDGFSERLRTLEAPSGESLNSTVPKLQALVADIQSQINQWATTRWTNAQILEQIDAKIAAAFAGNVAITGSLTINGGLAAASLSTAGSLYVGQKVTAPDIYALNVVTAGRPRVAVWVDAAGEVGHT